MENHIDRASNRLGFSLIIAAIVVASSIIMSTHIGRNMRGFRCSGWSATALPACSAWDGQWRFFDQEGCDWGFGSMWTKKMPPPSTAPDVLIEPYGSIHGCACAAKVDLLAWSVAQCGISTPVRFSRFPSWSAPDWDATAVSMRIPMGGLAFMVFPSRHLTPIKPATSGAPRVHALARAPSKTASPEGQKESNMPLQQLAKAKRLWITSRKISPASASRSK
jgi:hypothetical protein